MRGGRWDDVVVTDVVTREACARAEQPPPRILGPLNPVKTVVSVIFTLPHLTEVILTSGSENLGTALSNENGEAPHYVDPHPHSG